MLAAAAFRRRTGCPSRALAKSPGSDTSGVRRRGSTSAIARSRCRHRRWSCEAIEVRDLRGHAPIRVDAVVERERRVAIDRLLLDLAVGRKRDRAAVGATGAGAQVVLVEEVLAKVDAEAAAAAETLAGPIGAQRAAAARAGKPRDGDRRSLSEPPAGRGFEFGS